MAAVWYSVGREVMAKWWSLTIQSSTTAMMKLTRENLEKSVNVTAIVRKKN